MNRTYHRYELTEMVRDTKISERLVNRIIHLVNVHAIRIQASKGVDRDDTFVAYASGFGPALTYHAVLLIHITNGPDVAVDYNHKPVDYMAKIVEILTKYAYILRKY